MRRCLVLSFVILVAGCGRRSTEDLIKELKDADAARRLEAVRELGRRDEAAVVPALVEALKDANGYVRRDAALALGKFGQEARLAVSGLLAARKDKERMVRKAVAEALRSIDPQAAAKAGIP